MDDAEKALCRLRSLEHELAMTKPEAACQDACLVTSPPDGEGPFSRWLEQQCEGMEEWRWRVELSGSPAEDGPWPVKGWKLFNAVWAAVDAESTIQAWMAMGGNPWEQSMPLDTVTLLAQHDAELRFTTDHGKALGMVCCLSFVTAALSSLSRARASRK